MRRTNIALWHGMVVIERKAVRALVTENVKGAVTALEPAAERASTFHYLSVRER